LALAVGDVEHLVDDQTQGRPREIDLLVTAIDDDLAGAGLQPDARDRILAAAGGISAALLVELLLAQDGLDLWALIGDTMIVDLLLATAAATAALVALDRGCFRKIGNGFGFSLDLRGLRVGGLGFHRTGRYV